MQWLLILSSLAGLWVLSNVWSLVTNYLTARKSSFPISVAPTNPSNFLWMVLCVPLRPILSNFLPAAIWESMRKSVYGWEYADRYVTHKRLGQSFMLVTPGKNELWVAEPELANAILVQRKDFHQSELTARMWCLSSCHLKAYQHHSHCWLVWTKPDHGTTSPLLAFRL